MEVLGSPSVRTNKGKWSSWGRGAGFHLIQSLSKLLPGASLMTCGGTTCNHDDIVPEKPSIILAVTDRATAFQGSQEVENKFERDGVTAAAGGEK